MLLPQQDKDLLISAVKEAGKKLLRGRVSQPMEKHVKGKFDFGIPADKESEQFLFEKIQQVSFEYRIVSEEAGKIGKKDAPFVFFIDPLDGTINYAKGIPTFCVSLAVYTADQQPVFSVITHPASDETIVVDGMKIFLNDQPVERKKDIEQPLVHIDWYGATTYEKYIHLLRAQGIRGRTMGSGVLNLVYTALGRGEISVILDNKSWDVAAGLHACRASGLVVRSLDGKIDIEKPLQNVVVYTDELKSFVSFLFEE